MKQLKKYKLKDLIKLYTANLTCLLKIAHKIVIAGSVEAAQLHLLLRKALKKH